MLFFHEKDAARAMIQKRILVVHPSPAEADRLARLAQKYGPVGIATDLEALLPALAEGDVAAAVIDESFAGSPAPPSSASSRSGRARTRGCSPSRPARGRGGTSEASG